MRIGIDARPLQGETQFRGIGKAFQFLLEAILDGHSSDNSFVFYVDDGLPVPGLLHKFPDARFLGIPTTRLGQKRYFRSFLPSHKMPNPLPEDVDVFFQYDAYLGVPTSVPTVVVFHDLIPFLFRDAEKQEPAKGVRKFKNALAGHLYWKKYLRTLRQYKRAAKIIAISESSKRDYIEHLGYHKPEDITVIYHGVGGFHEPGKPSAQAKKLAAKPYLLYVGAIDFRKNVVGLLHAFYDLKRDYPDLRLLAIGKEFALHDQLADRGWFKLLNSRPDYAKDVLTPGFVGHDDLTWLYQRAEAFVFPSRYEGFGLPILEAMQAGCPVIAYSNSSIPEVAGNAALLVDDGQAVAPAIRELLSDTSLRTKLIASGKEQVKKFTWEATAEKTIKLLAEAGRKQ